MKLVVKDMDIATGGVEVVILNEKDAALWDLHHMDRVRVKGNEKSTVAVIDIGESDKAVPPGRIGLFEEVLDALGVVDGDTVTISFAEKPASVSLIRKKMDGKELNKKEMQLIVADIVEDRLTQIELTSFVTASYVRGLSERETIYLTEAMAATGAQLDFNHGKLVDLHSIGGVPGNRTTIIIVPILAAAGLKVPKTSSRAITSPSGTADTMEVLCPVVVPLSTLKTMLKRIGAFMIWGGAVNLAPADDKIIKVEHPLNIDAEGQMIASILAKKASVGAAYLLLEIPYGSGTKISSRQAAERLGREFKKIGKKIGISVELFLGEGTQPVGSGIGAALEARDCLWILRNDPRGPDDLKQKSFRMAGQILERTGKAAKGKGYAVAEHMLSSGKAYHKLVEIIRAQGGRETLPEHIPLARYKQDFVAMKSGTISSINNETITRIARFAGAPDDKGAGLYLHVRKGSKVKKGDALLTIYSESKERLQYAVEEWKKGKCVTIR